MCKILKGIRCGTVPMAMKEQSQRIYGPIALLGFQEKNVRTEIRIATINHPQEVAGREHKGGKEVMSDL